MPSRDKAARRAAQCRTMERFDRVWKPGIGLPILPGSKGLHNMRSITDVLGDLDRGRVFRALNSELAGLVAAVRATGKAGELTLKLKIKPNGDNQVEITDEIKAKVPEPARPKTLMFIAEDNSLIRSDPRQAALPLQEVEEEPEGELKTA
jgi:hypothetical protein